MRLRKLRLQQITRFADPVEVDFAALGEGLVAIAGVNGAGKTSVLESPFACLHGYFPTRDQAGLYGVAHGRDARIEVELESGGQPYRATVAVDAVGQRTEAYLHNGDGSPITSGKVREYLAETERRFGSPRLMLAAALSAQNKRGAFLDLSKVERKALLADILDVEGLQVLSEAARARLRAGELALERARGQLAEAEAEIARLEAGAVDVEAARATRDRLAGELAEQQASVEDLRTRYATVQAARAAAEETAKGRARIAAALEEVTGRQRTLQAQRQGIDSERVALVARIAAARYAAEGEAARGPECREAAGLLAVVQARRSAYAADLERQEAPPPPSWTRRSGRRRCSARCRARRQAGGHRSAMATCRGCRISGTLEIRSRSGRTARSSPTPAQRARPSPSSPPRWRRSRSSPRISPAWRPRRPTPRSR